MSEEDDAARRATGSINRSIRSETSGARGNSVVGKHKKNVLALVEHLGSVTTAEVAQHMKCCESDAYARLIFLAYGGLIDHVEANRWTFRSEPRRARPRGKKPKPKKARSPSGAE